MISKDKQYRTRDGREVRIYATDGAAYQRVHGAIFHKNEWMQHSWGADGSCEPCPSERDLIEVKPRIQRTVWLNVYQHHMQICATKEEADDSDRCRLACVKVEIDCEEGEGL